MTSFLDQRRDMVQCQLVERGIEDLRVLDAIRTVPRERFVPERYRELSYRDGPLPIEQDQTISQPYIVALMAEALKLEDADRVLEVGDRTRSQELLRVTRLKDHEYSQDSLGSVQFVPLVGSEGWQAGAPEHPTPPRGLR